MIDRSQNIYVLCIGVAIELGKIFADRMMRIGKMLLSVKMSMNSSINLIMQPKMILLY